MRTPKLPRTLSSSKPHINSTNPSFSHAWHTPHVHIFCYERGASGDDKDVADIVQSKSDCEEYRIDSPEINDSVSGEKASDFFPTKPHESFHWYLSNAEVQVNSWKLSIWQKSKVVHVLKVLLLIILCYSSVEI